MTNRILEAQGQASAKAHAEFVAACWRGAAVEELLTLAGPAGLTVQKADALRQELAQAQADKREADAIPRLRREASNAKATFEKLRTESEAKIKELEEATDAAAVAADDATRKLREAEGAGSRLHALAERGLVPPALLPKEVLTIRKREAREAAKLRIHQAWGEAREYVRQVEREISDAERTLQKMRAEAIDEYTVGDVTLTPAIVERRLGKLREALPVARRELTKARAAARKAGFNVP